jgi:hypothetical protein
MRSLGSKRGSGASNSTAMVSISAPVGFGASIYVALHVVIQLKNDPE